MGLRNSEEKILRVPVVQNIVSTCDYLFFLREKAAILVIINGISLCLICIFLIDFQMIFLHIKDVNTFLDLLQVLVACIFHFLMVSLMNQISQF